MLPELAAPFRTGRAGLRTILLCFFLSAFQTVWVEMRHSAATHPMSISLSRRVGLSRLPSAPSSHIHSNRIVPQDTQRWVCGCRRLRLHLFRHVQGQLRAASPRLCPAHGVALTDGLRWEEASGSPTLPVRAPRAADLLDSK